MTVSDKQQPEKPLPDVHDPVVAPFWEATRERRLVLPRCTACRYQWWPPEPICPQCQTPGPGWEEVPATGVLWSFATYHRAFDPAFADLVPYVVGLVQLDAGPLMYGLVHGPPGEVRVGRRMRAEFEPVTSSVTYVRWRGVEQVPDGSAALHEDRSAGGGSR